MLNFTPAKIINLRDYQEDAVEALRQGIRIGTKRQILCAGTGAGKTVMAAHLLRQAHEKGSYALFLVDRVELVKQTSRTLDEYGIPHGIVCQSALNGAPLSASKRDPSGDVVSRPVAA